jgi:hypothetical protein
MFAVSTNAPTTIVYPVIVCYFAPPKGLMAVGMSELDQTSLRLLTLEQTTTAIQQFS